MVLGRRQRPGIARRLRGLLWPESGWRRALAYLGHRIQRLPGTPHSIAAGFASGAAASFTPFLGFHFLLSFFLCFLARGNYLAAALGTAVGNPWTFPFMFAWTYHLGRALLGDSASATLRVSEVTATGFFEGLGEYLLPMTVGSLPTMLVVWVLVYLPVRRVVAAFQNARRRRREARRRGGSGAAERPGGGERIAAGSRIE